MNNPRRITETIEALNELIDRLESIEDFDLETEFGMLELFKDRLSKMRALSVKVEMWRAE
ncbi:MAG: hypothetical protein ACI9IA_000200 [Enterobacterales bacterium]|jgi:hypothetical protein